MRSWYQALEPFVVTAAKQFELGARAATLHSLDESLFWPPPALGTTDVVQSNLVKVYTDKMVGRQAPGRQIYDAIRLAAKRCPLCGHRSVTTLDHHLPKTGFPLLSVVPDNLIPACSECNRIKTDSRPQTVETQTLHPYFDSIDETAWLVAEVVEVSPPPFRFFVSPPSSWPESLAARVSHHFEVFGLEELYAVQANDEVAGIASFLSKQHEAAGDIAVREHLAEMALSWSKVRPNSWNAAAYRAMAESTWFCSGGFMSA
ncbi:HNH endonuclease signature motif containing protein [Dactylosporangium sp. NPDC005555]|uniref:HNH endonuclease signature motif containing protein n=1 Tax=Dactylosporangium sp. NPDC005555 TaxID=3154889 RepID=UPI0033A8B055